MTSHILVVRLGDYCEVDSGFAFKSERFSQNPGDINLVKGSNLGHRTIDWDEGPKWPKDEFEKLKFYELITDDVVLAMDRPIVGGNLKFAWMTKSDPQALLVQRVARLRAKGGLDQIYLRYVIADSVFKLYIDTITTGANIPHVSGPDIRDYKFPLPSIATQKKIAAILSAYDDLIENNLQRIKLLEEMAQITYEEWFVRLKFPGHETTQLDSTTRLPEGWRFGKTLDLFELQRGFDLPIQEREDGVIPIIASTGVTGFHSTYKVKGPGVVTGRSGTVGQVMFVDSDFWPLNTTLWVKKFKSCGPIFVKHFLENFNLESLCGGSAVPSLDRKAVHVQKVAIPAAELTKKFEIYASSLYDTTKVLRSQNELLKEARDILLPRLMTGMIDVDTVGADLSARMNMVAPCEYPLGHK